MACPVSCSAAPPTTYRKNERIERRVEEKDRSSIGAEHFEGDMERRLDHRLDAGMREKRVAGTPNRLDLPVAVVQVGGERRLALGQGIIGRHGPSYRGEALSVN